MRSSALLLISFAAWALPSLAHAVCGDGLVDSDDGEECDDTNSDDGDGCDSACLIEAGWECTDAEFEAVSEENYSSSHSSPNWTVSSDGTVLTQSVNADPSIYVTTLPDTWPR